MLIEQTVAFELRERGPPGRIMDVGVLSHLFTCNFLTVLPLPTTHVSNLAFLG